MENSKKYYITTDLFGDEYLVRRDGKVLISKARDIKCYGLRNGTSDFAVARVGPWLGEERYVMVDKEGHNVFGRPLRYIDANEFLAGRTNIIKVDLGGYHSPVRKMYAVQYENGKFNIVQHLGDEPIFSDKLKIHTAIDKLSSLINKIKEKIFGNKNTNNPWVKNVRFALYKDRLEQGNKYKPEKPQENYSIVRTERGEAIANEKGEVITPYFKKIDLGIHDTNYYIATREDGKQALFHLQGGQISPWAESIYSQGLLEGTSGLYILKDKKGAVIMDRFGPVSEHHDYIFPYGIVSGHKPYYMYIDKKFGKPHFNIADVYGKPILNQDYDDMKAQNFLLGRSNKIAVALATNSIIDSVLNKEPEYRYGELIIHEDEHGVLVDFVRYLSKEEFEKYDEINPGPSNNDINSEKISTEESLSAEDQAKKQKVSYELEM